MLWQAESTQNFSLPVCVYERLLSRRGQTSDVAFSVGIRTLGDDKNRLPVHIRSFRSSSGRSGRWMEIRKIKKRHPNPTQPTNHHPSSFFVCVLRIQLGRLVGPLDGAMRSGKDYTSPTWYICQQHSRKLNGGLRCTTTALCSHRLTCGCLFWGNWKFKAIVPFSDE